MQQFPVYVYNGKHFLNTPDLLKHLGLPIDATPPETSVAMYSIPSHDPDLKTIEVSYNEDGSIADIQLVDKTYGVSISAESEVVFISDYHYEGLTPVTGPICKWLRNGFLEIDGTLDNAANLQMAKTDAIEMVVAKADAFQAQFEGFDSEARKERFKLNLACAAAIVGGTAIPAQITSLQDQYAAVVAANHPVLATKTFDEFVAWLNDFNRLKYEAAGAIEAMLTEGRTAIINATSFQALTDTIEYLKTASQTKWLALMGG